MTDAGMSILLKRPKHGCRRGNSQMGEKTFKAEADIALVGEIEVRRELAAEGWLAINTNTEKGNFPNVDLITAKGDRARAIQVKTTDAEKGSHTHAP